MSECVSQKKRDQTLGAQLKGHPMKLLQPSNSKPALDRSESFAQLIKVVRIRKDLAHLVATSTLFVTKTAFHKTGAL